MSRDFWEKWLTEAGVGQAVQNYGIRGESITEGSERISRFVTRYAPKPAIRTTHVYFLTLGAQL